MADLRLRSVADLGSVAFVDCETTGLDPRRHEIWELAIIVDGKEHEFHIMPEHGKRSDPTALRINRFYQRTAAKDWYWHGITFAANPAVAQHGFAEGRIIDAGQIATLLAGRHIVGAVPSFDAAFIDAFLRRHGQVAAWHYHLIDVEALAAGWLRGKDEGYLGRDDLPIPPWNSEALSIALGVTPDRYERHTALGDARWAKAIYEAVMGVEG